MDLQLTGKVTQILEEQSGQGKNGPWRKRDFILETKGQYPKQVCITQWGDNIDQNAVNKGDEITASIDIQSREYKGNWYTDVKAWKIEQAQGDVQAPPSAPGLTMDGNQEMDLDDDLPF
jgi:hypothetical protein